MIRQMMVLLGSLMERVKHAHSSISTHLAAIRKERMIS